MDFDFKKINKESSIDYEKTWQETKNLLKLKGDLFQLEQKGNSHLINDFIVYARTKMINLGFEELILPMFVEEEEIYKQYGPEAVLILDRVFYLAGLPRPDIGISKEKIEKIKSIIPNFNQINELQNIFRRYKKNEIEADDLIEVFIEELKIEESNATELIDKVFPELKGLKPIPSKMTLRSHTTALWFKVLSQLIKKKTLPLQYFSICPKFRREQKLDATHLIDSNTISLVILTPEISLEDCQKIAKQICEEFGFKNSKSTIKKATSKYYAPQTEFEVFVEHPKTKEWIEIGDGGFYSPVSLSKYEIPYPVFNIGFGVERICMIKTGIEDIRKLVYPYFYEEISFTDHEIASGLKYKKVPLTETGIEIKNAIVKIAREYKDAQAPLEINVWEGTIKNKKIRVTLWEKDQGVRLLGPAALNKVWVKEGNIVGLAPDEKLDNAIDSGLTYLEGIAAEMAYNIEILLDQKIEFYEHRVKMCYRASEVNLTLDDIIMEFLWNSQKKFDIRGPVFIGLSFETIEEKEIKG
ncbi:MAG: O-phosphoserine--tRNA ligase [Candidatus Lokiarchaeota archaeon]|nr:O-phosphoserine--tRNA ligase [Candidatus Lokiarchaeota archaeon]